MELLLTIFTAFFVFVSLIIIVVLRRAGRKLTARKRDVNTGLPSVSVCIPARNEAHALSACLDRVLASDYEKLEILVLDDESVDQTPTLIKSFAHAGVRFIAGRPLPYGWVGKNHALDTLCREASGELIVFLDVDVHISTKTITMIVKSLPDGVNVSSIIPLRRDTHRASALFGHLRYFWDMVHVGLGGVSASASAWCVRREWLLESNRGFEVVRDAIRPELAVAADKNQPIRLFYGYDYGVTYEKRWHSQMESSERLIVPTLRRYGARAYLTVLWVILASCIVPLTLVTAITQSSATAIVAFYGGIVSGYAVIYTYLSRVWLSRAWIGALLWWWVASQELVLVAVSTIRYATKTVTWKGRSIDAQPENDDYYSI